MRLKKGRVDVDPLKTTAQALASRNHWMDAQSCRRLLKNLVLEKRTTFCLYRISSRKTESNQLDKVKKANYGQVLMSKNVFKWTSFTEAEPKAKNTTSLGQSLRARKPRLKNKNHVF